MTNRYYVGMHSTSKLDDGYMGSGKRLRYSIKKYGIDNHKREVLKFFEDRELLIEAEEKIITYEMVIDPNCMNLRKGGTGGFTVEQQRINQIKSTKKRNELWNDDPEWRNRTKCNLTLGQLKSYEVGNRERFYFYTWTGKTHSDETKRKIGIKNSIKQKGEKNSQHGSCWITNGINNKKIIKNELIPLDWKLGRTVKNNS